MIRRRELNPICADVQQIGAEDVLLMERGGLAVGDDVGRQFAEGSRLHGCRVVSNVGDVNAVAVRKFVIQADREIIFGGDLLRGEGKNSGISVSRSAARWAWERKHSRSDGCCGVSTAMKLSTQKPALPRRQIRLRGGIRARPGPWTAGGTAVWSEKIAVSVVHDSQARVRGGHGIYGGHAQRLAQPFIIPKNKGAAFLDRQSA